MLNSNLLLSALAFSAALIFVFLGRRSQKRSNLPLPPGPKGLPLVGNVHDVQPSGCPGEYRWKRYLQWSREYNSPHAVSVEIFGQRMIILNSKKAVIDLLEKRSANYSDRPEMTMTDDLSGWKWDFAHMKYSDWWRLHRKTFHQYFQPRVMPEYYEIQRAASERLVRKLATSPEGFFSHVRDHASSIVLKIAYGYDLQGENDPYIQLARKAVEGIVETLVHGTFLVDFLPVLKYIPAWFPGATFKRKANAWKKYSYELRDVPWKWHMESITKGTAEPSFITRHLEKLSSSMEDEEREAMLEVIKNCAGVSYMAGSDTTVSLILSVILNLLRYPEIQARAQSEVDSLGRLPDFSDKGKLPFVEAIIAETFRCTPVQPLAVPHAAMQDDVYEGMWIPKGATIVGNVWAILHDEELYPDPMVFNPERFIKKDVDEKLPPHPETFGFGFGRRICPGRYLALNSVWIAVTHILATFTIIGDGELPKEIQYNDGHISHPYPFKCKFIPRSGPGSIRM